MLIANHTNISANAYALCIELSVKWQETIVMPDYGLWLSGAKMPKIDIDFYSIIL